MLGDDVQPALQWPMARSGLSRGAAAVGICCRRDLAASMQLLARVHGVAYALTPCTGCRRVQGLVNAPLAGRGGEHDIASLYRLHPGPQICLLKTLSDQSASEPKNSERRIELREATEMLMGLPVRMQTRRSIRIAKLAQRLTFELTDALA